MAWLNLLGMAVKTGAHIYKNRQESKMLMSDAQRLHAEKMAKGQIDYQGKLLESRQSDWKDEFILLLLSAPIVLLAWAVFSLLIRPFAGAQKTKGGILLADTTIETIQATTVVGLVISMGNLCYRDKEKFPLGPWCKEGQFVMYGRYAGSRFKNKWGEHRILNDDEIIGVIQKPEDIATLY
jgi:co-chaperonin GroES (HSP10)